MHYPPVRILRLGVVLGALALVSTACARSATHPAAGPTSGAPSRSGMPGESMMASPEGSMMASSPGGMTMQAGAGSMHVAITSPPDGTKVTGTSMSVSFTTSGFTDTCDTAGRPPVQGDGHVHLALDNVADLVDMYCTSPVRISMQNLKPGMHKLIAVPAQNDHTEVEANQSAISFDYDPAQPLADVTDASPPGPPSIKISNLKAGQTISGAFDVTVQISNFDLNCDLEGKPDVAGYGHWHVNLDTASGPMMGMGSMLRMGCINGVATTTIHTTTAGLRSGDTHTIIALLVDNNHAPLHPLVADKVDVKIG